MEGKGGQEKEGCRKGRAGEGGGKLNTTVVLARTMIMGNLFRYFEFQIWNTS